MMRAPSDPVACPRLPTSAGRLEQLLAAGDWAAAHSMLCGVLAPRWFLGGPGGRQALEEALQVGSRH